VLTVAGRRQDLLSLDEPLSWLAAQEPVKAELVKLRSFADLSLAEAVAFLDLSLATAKRSWSVARAWLFAALAEPSEQAPP